MKKLLALLLASLMCVSVLASCGSDSKTPAQTTGSASTAEETDEEILQINDYVATLASQHKLDGATFTYVGGGGQTAEFQEETGNIENDALYHRERELEETLGITWEGLVAEGTDTADSATAWTVEYVKQAVLAGSKDYDLCYGTLVVTIQPLFNEDCLESVTDFSVLDLDADWWPSTLRDTHSIGGELYFLTGPIMTEYYTDACCLLVNSQVADDYNIEIPYDEVRDGNWTFDRMFEVASVVPTNSSGSGAYRYGDPNGLAILFANGHKVTKFDDDDVPYVDANPSADLVDLCDRFAAVMGDGTQTAQVIYERSDDCEEKYGYGDLDEMFINSGYLFRFADTGTAVGLREKEVEYGILPMPKGTASQSQYYSYADNWAGRFCAIPRCTRDLEVTDVVVEAMAALSVKHIKPAYYDKILKGRSTHDSDSRDMLDIIFDSKIYDIVDIYAKGSINQSGSFVRIIEKAIKYDSSSISSGYNIEAKMATRSINSIMKMIESHQK